MTREEVKALLPVLTSYAEGGIIQQTDGYDWYDIDDPDFLASAKSYRIKPNPKYRPFANAKECWIEMRKHEPFGWINEDREITDFDDIILDMIVSVSFDEVRIAPYFEENDCNIVKGTVCGGDWTFEEAFNRFCFADGTPFGVIVNE